VKRIFAMLMACLFMVSVMLVMAAPAFAKITKENRGGNEPGGEARRIPAKNPADKCPPGQNKDLSPGGQKKC
jgi:hypothetical protein